MSENIFVDLSANELLKLMGEELKQPLVTISQLSEFSNSNKEINVLSKKALRTIDNILMYQRISSGQQKLNLEPVHVGSTIFDVATELEELTKLHNCTQNIEIQNSIAPIYADRELLKGGIESMWQSILSSVERPTEIICRADRYKDGVKISVVARGVALDRLSLNHLNKESQQPSEAIAGSSADLITAGAIYELLGVNITRYSRSSRHGLGVIIEQSNQLQMV